MTEELQKKVNRAIKLLKSAEKKAKEFDEPVEICYSGGKDSDVILELARMAEINYKAIYRNTTIDPCGTIKHAIERGAEVKRPKQTFFQIIETRGFPTRFFRFCCSTLKEYKILNVAVMGVRRDESKARAERYKEPTACRFYGSKKNHVHAFYPILDWSNEDVKVFLEYRKVKCAPEYYDENGVFHVERRLGCMCCPLQSRSKMLEDFKRYPKMVRQYIRRGSQFIDYLQIGGGQAKQLEHFKNVYEKFFFHLFCDNMKEFHDKVDPTMFDDGLDCKKYLEDYFKIKLD